MVFGISKLFLPSHDSVYEDGRDQYHSNDYDDNTIDENTIASEGTATTKSILRKRCGGRRMRKNTERNVSWSNTYDTYDDHGGGDNCTFETLDTFETRDDYDSDEFVSDDQEEENLIRDFNFIYPGETDMSYGQTETFDTMQSVSVSSEMDGTVELQHIADRPLQPTPMQPVTQASAVSSQLPPPTMAPKPVERKQLADMVLSQQPMRISPLVQYNMNLACSSTVSEGTIEERKDRYEGLCRAESEDTYQNWSLNRVNEDQRRANINAIKISDVFIPRQSVEIPDQIIHALASDSDSNSEVDVTLDNIIDDIYSDTSTYDMNRIRAASDDESIVSLTKKDTKLNLLFESQKQADSIAGHIGLILPFLDQVKLNTELMAKDVLNRVTESNARKNQNGTDVQISDGSEVKPQNKMFDEKNLLQSLVKSASNDCGVSNFKHDTSSGNILSVGEGYAPSNDSDESYELSEYEAPVKGEVIRMQDLRGNKHGWARKKVTLSANEDINSSQSQQVVAMDHSAMDIQDQDRKKFQGRWLPWGWRKKCKSINSTLISDRFDPTLLPQGDVEDDDLSCSGSCITTESILSELKVIEKTAKLIYQQLCTSPSEELCTSPEYISALLSPTATELILECNPQDEKKETVGGNKKGGKLREFLGKCIPKKRLSCGPVCGVTAIWDPTQEETPGDNPQTQKK
jgi:hypothetical protein